MGMLDGLLGQVLGGAMQGGGGGGGGLQDILAGMSRGGMGGLPGTSGMDDAQRGGLGGAGTAALIAMALQLLQSNGGLEGLLGRLQQAGHAHEANSWVSTGENLPVSSDALARALGADQIDEAAQRLGLSSQDTARGLASVLPEIVNQVTPQGRIEDDSNAELARALRALTDRFG